MVRIEYRHYSIILILLRYMCHWYRFSKGLHENLISDIIYLYTDYIIVLLANAVDELKFKNKVSDANVFTHSCSTVLLYLHVACNRGGAVVTISY